MSDIIILSRERGFFICPHTAVILLSSRSLDKNRAKQDGGFMLGAIMKTKKYCKNCDKEFDAIHKKDKYCSQSCRSSHYYKTHKKEFLKRAGQYRARNKDKIKQWYQENRETLIVYYRQRARQLRIDAIEKYGKVCACCGESLFEFLVIDHIDGGGSKHRKQIGVGAGAAFYGWLKNNNYPPSYRVLCHNCNSSLGLYGYCPHNVSESVAVSRLAEE